MAKKNLNYPDELRAKLQEKANRTFNGNLNALMVLLLHVADKHHDIQDIERLKEAYGGEL